MMQLSKEQIQNMTQGAVRMEEQEEGLRFYRFTKEQEMLYQKRSDDFYKKTFATTGVRLVFRTDSTELFLKANILEKGSSRNYFAFDVLVDGKRIDSISNFDEAIADTYYARVEGERGTFAKTIALGEGMKTVRIDFPWSMQVALEELSLNGTVAEPVKRSKKLLAFGDSITQGYDALHPSQKYISQLAEFLDAEEYNKAIGGETFFPELAKTQESFVPDYITVAYGANDWNKKTREDFETDCLEFYQNLRKTYPDVPMFAITPIWRKDMTEERPFGKFDEVDGCIREQVKDIPNLTVISGRNFVPEDSAYYADAILHPNDKGFEYYAKHIIAAIKNKQGV